jgi:hypothetical protein
MKNTLYTFIFEKNEDSYDCLGLCSQIKEIDSANIFIVFQNKEVYEKYKEYISVEKKEYISYISDNSKIYLYDILKNFYHKYKYFFISKHTKIFINKNYIHKNENIKNSTIFLEEKNISGIMFCLEDLLKSNLKIDDIINNNIDEKYFNIKKHPLPIKILNIENNQEIKNTKKTENIIYENDLCLFTFLQGTGDMIGSMVYFNKNNYKIYNINNNILGEVKYYDIENLEVKWGVTEQIFVIYKYYKKENTYYIKT